MNPRPARFNCTKCGNRQCEVGEIRTTGGFWSKIFNVQNRQFSTVTCSSCRYTEIYQADASKMANIFDLLAGS